MLKKRKSAATTPTTSKTTAKTISTPSPAPPKKQKKLDVQPKIEQQLPKIVQQPPPPKIEEKQPPIEEQLEEVEEEIEEEIEEEVEEEEEEEGSEEEQEQGEETTEQQQQEEQEDEDEDDEPISSLIEPFTKEQLTTIVREAAEKHSDVATIVRKLADKDIVHRKIFIHGLGWDTTTETLISAFKDYGEIEDCKAVTDKLTGKSKGYGFIVFKTRTGARKALKEPQKTISGRTASCQLAALGASSNNSEKGFNAAAPPVVGFQTEYTQRKIYISNVSAELDPAKLTAYFSRFGEIEDGPLGIDKGTGKFKGFCLFVYKSVESARKALEEPHKLYEGHTLHCQRAIDGPKPGKGYSGHSGGSYGTGGHGRGGGSGYVRGQNPSLPIGSGGGLVGQGMVGAGVNPALGHALTALLASQGAGLGLNNLLGSLGGSGVANMGQSSGYGAPVGLSGYGSQTGLQSVYPNPQLGQGGGVGRSQHGGYSGAPYGGH